MPTINKSDIVIKVTENLEAQGIEVTKGVVIKVLQSIINEITNGLAEGNNIVARDFGTFQVRQMKAKVGRNPKNPEETITIPNRARVVFRAGKELKEKVEKNIDVI
jgi:nucleoid DNA-binding protein